ncbi:MAG: hypothetical protein R6V50_00775 [Thermoplasmatota archaeon]
MKKIVVLVIGFFLLLTISVASLQAGGDNNQNTHGENGNYEENNNNPYPNNELPGDNSQQRNGVVWS